MKLNISSFLFGLFVVFSLSSFSVEEADPSTGECWEDSITIYHAGLIHHGDCERAIENAAAYLEFCLEEEHGIIDE